MNRITLIILALFIYNISFAQKGLFIKPYVGGGITGIKATAFIGVPPQENNVATTIGADIGKKLGIFRLSVGAALLNTGSKVSGMIITNGQ